MIKPVDFQVMINGAYVSVDIDRSVSFPFNIARDVLTNPALTKIPFSSQISLPRTQNNDHIFSSIFKIDSKYLHFNPLKRNDFVLYVSGTLFESGYFAIEEVTRMTYKIRLYGGLGDYFYTMKEISEDRDMSLSKLDFGKLFTHDINKDKVYSHWHHGESEIGEYYDYSTQSNVKEPILKYAMTYQGKYENFDSNYVTGEGTQKEEVTWSSDKKVYSSPDLNEHSRSFIITDSTGFKQQYYGEFRSYYQRPAIRFKTLYNKILEKMALEENGGWETELDKTFFNSYNPYWNDLWLLMPGYDISGGDGGVQSLQTRDTWGIPYSSNADGRTDAILKDVIPQGVKANIVVNLPFYVYGIPDGTRDYLQNKKGEFLIYGEVYIGGKKHGEMKYDYTGSNVVTLNVHTIHGYRPRSRDPFKYTRKGGSNSNEGTLFRLIYTGTLDESATDRIIEIKLRYTGDTGWKKYKHGKNNFNIGMRLDFEGATLHVGSLTDGEIRSGSSISYERIVRSEHTCYDLLHSYSKVFGLIYEKDIYKKKVSIMTRNSFFALREKVDWTHKIDYSKDDSTRLVPFDYANGVFKWNDTGSKYEELYLNGTNKEYGSARFYTDYEFSDQTHEYLDGILFDNCVVATDYSQYYLDRDPVLYKDNKTLPFLQDASGDAIETAFIPVFYNGLSEPLKVPFAISDDTGAMLTYGYSFTDTDLKTCKTYPLFGRSTVSNGKEYSLNFGMPSVVYNGDETAGEKTTDGSTTIYTQFWKGYLKDKFDPDNRLMTCYVFLNPTDIQSNLFSKFIYINNSVWVLNKICSYDPLSSASAKVELLRVKDIENYVSQNYISGNLVIQSAEGTILYDASGQNENPSSNPVVIRIQDTETTVKLTLESSIVGWSVDEESLQEGVSVNPLSVSADVKVPVTITLPENATGSSVSYLIPVQWGNTLTIIQIISVSNWSVTATSNIGTATLNGLESPQRVTDGTNVNFDCNGVDGYTIGYWIINGAYYYGNPVSVQIEQDTHAEAFWYNSSEYVMLTCFDPYTTLSGKDKFGNYWLLTEGESYTFRNSQYGLSGYLFSGDSQFTNPASSITRMIQSTDNLLSVYYFTLLARLTVINHSSQSFDLSHVMISYPDGSRAESVSGSVDAGETEPVLYQMASTTYGTYTISMAESEAYKYEIDLPSWNYSIGSSIPSITITVEDADPVGWQNVRMTTYGTSLTNYLYIPENSAFQVTSNLLGVNIAPNIGIQSQEISFSLPENTTGSARTLTVTALINGAVYNFTIIQHIPVYLEIEPESTTVDNLESTYRVQVRSNAPWSVDIPSLYEDYFSASPLSGSGDGEVTVNLTSHTGTDSRRGEATFHTTTGEKDVSVVHTVIQDGES